MSEKKGVGLQAIEGIHQVDHLGVVCMGMDIPLLLTDEKTYLLARKYYPQLKAQLVDFSDVTPERLAAQYDIIYSSNFCEQNVFRKMFEPAESHYNKTVRSVYCPHGNSDKGKTYYWMEMFAEEDIIFLYGQQMIDFLKDKGVFDRIDNYVITGNYRYPYYRDNRAFYDAIVEDEVFSRLPKGKKTILYAPTWNTGDTSFFSAYSYLLDDLPEEYNLIVKMHPGMETEHFGAVYRILSQYEERSDILFLRDFPLVYPILEKVDIYIGDMSSIGYDFLLYNRPMFFLNEYAQGIHARNDFYLFRCGTEVIPGNYPKIYQMINESLSSDQQRFSKAREKTYRYTFGQERPFSEIRLEVLGLCEKQIVQESPND